MKWDEVYKKPFNRRHSKVFTSGYNMAFDFIHPYLVNMFDGQPALPLSDVEMDLIVGRLNGDNTETLEGLQHDRGLIKMNGSIIAVIRGWGQLTGLGGLNMKTEDAVKIQNDFGDYIVNILSNSDKNVQECDATKAK